MTIALNDLFKSVDCLRLARLDMCVLDHIEIKCGLFETG